MTRASTLFLTVIVMAGLGVLTSSQALATPVEYWQINKYSQEKENGDGENGDGEGAPQGAPENGVHEVVWFEITNEHATDPITGFGVGLTEPRWSVASNYYPIIEPDSQGQGELWYTDILHKDEWPDTHSYKMPYTTFKDYFGMTWDEAFGAAYEYAFVAWDDQTDAGAGAITPGMIYSDDVYDWGAEFEYVWSPEGAPVGSASVEPLNGPPAAIAMGTGGGTGYSGGSNQPNSFPGGPGPGPEIPEPATLCLFALAGAAVAARRRRLG